LLLEEDVFSPVAFDFHPSLSADGSTAVAGRVIGHEPTFSNRIWELRLFDLEAGTAATVDLVDGAGNPAPLRIATFPDDPGGPRASLSPDGQVVYYVHRASAGPGSLFTALRRLAAVGGPQQPCDLIDGDYVLGAPQSPISSDGRFVAAIDDGGTGRRQVVRLDVDASPCPSAPAPATPLRLTTLDSVRTDHPTISADGKRVAWTSDWRHCATGTYPTTNVWVWDEALDVATEPCPGAECCLLASAVPQAGAVGSLVRVTPDVTRADDELPAISADGRRLVWIAAFDYFAGSPLGRAVVQRADLGGSVSESWFRAIDQPLTNESLPDANAASFVTLSGDGSVVVAQVGRDSDGDGLLDDFELRLAAPDEPPALPLADAAHAAHLPFEVVTSCAPDGAGTVDMTATVRQYRGGPRHVVVVLEVQAQGGSLVRRGPLVQPLGELLGDPGDETKAEIAWAAAVDGDAEAGIEVCRAVAVDGAVVRPDVVVGQ
jgi:hypothetical protein